MANWVESILEHQPEASRLPIMSRDRYGLHFKREGRHRLGLVSGAPVHYFDTAQRAWLAIDTRLQARGDGSFGAPGLPFSLGLDGDVKVDGDLHRHKAWRVGVVVGSKFAELTRLGEAVVKNDRIVRESGALRHEIILLPGGLREQLTLQEAPRLTAKDGLFVIESLLPGNSLSAGWVGDAQRGSLRFPTGSAIDAAGSRIPLMRWVSENEKPARLYSGVPAQWLADAAYPVVIDPDIDITGETADTTLEGSSAATSTTYDAAGASLSVGAMTFGGAPHLWRGYLKFNTSSLGMAATVEQVNLQVYVTNLLATIGFTTYVRQYNWSAQDPFSHANREAAWDGLYATSNTVALATNANGIGATVVSPNLLTAWVAILGNTYYGLWSNQEAYGFANGQGAFHYYGSANNATPAQRPLLMLEYLAGYPRSGPVPLRGVVPAPRASIVDTRRILRARSRRTSLQTSYKQSSEPD